MLFNVGLYPMFHPASLSCAKKYQRLRSALVTESFKYTPSTWVCNDKLAIPMSR